MWTFNAVFSAPLTGITESLQRYLFHWTKCWRNLAGHKHMEQRRNRPCGPLCLHQTLWHVQLLSCLHVIYVPFPCMVMCIFDLLPTPTPGSVFHMCVCVKNISHISFKLPPSQLKTIPSKCNISILEDRFGPTTLCLSYFYMLLPCLPLTSDTHVSTM